MYRKELEISFVNDDTEEKVTYTKMDFHKAINYHLDFVEGMRIRGKRLFDSNEIR